MPDCEPLKGKSIKEDCGCYHYEKDAVASAVEGFFNEFFERQERDSNLKMSDVLSLKRKWFWDVIE